MDGKHLSEYWSSVISIYIATSVGKKNKQWQSYRQKKSAKKTFLLEIYRWTNFICIFTGKSLTDLSSVIVASTVNILQLSMTFQRTMTVGVDVGDCGMGSKYFATLSEIPTVVVRL